MMALRFGLIGLGNFGKHYARLLQELPDVELQVIVNRSAGVFTEKNSVLPPTVQKTTNAGDIFENKDIDCVIIATPAATHYDLIRAALQADKHVLVEKPMVLTVAEATEICQLAQQQHRICLVGFQYVYNDYIRSLRELIQQGGLGKIFYVFGEHLYPGPIRSDVGCFLDAGVHELSMLQYLFNSGAVQSVVGQSLNFGVTTHDDFMAVTVRFEHGPLAHLVISCFAPQKTRRLTIVGERATAVFDDVAVESKLQIFEQPYPSRAVLSDRRSILFKNQPPHLPKVMAQEPLRNELEHFIHCVRTGQQPLTDAEFGKRVTETAEEILKKVQTATI